MFVRQQLNTLQWSKALNFCPTHAVLLMPYMVKQIRNPVKNENYPAG